MTDVVLTSPLGWTAQAQQAMQAQESCPREGLGLPTSAPNQAAQDSCLLELSSLPRALDLGGRGWNVEGGGGGMCVVACVSVCAPCTSVHSRWQ